MERGDASEDWNHRIGQCRRSSWFPLGCGRAQRSLQFAHAGFGRNQATGRSCGPNASAATAAQTVADSDVTLLSTPWPATQGALAAAGSLAGKILIDATNPLLPNLAGIEFGTTTSGAEHVATWAPGARVVKAFNTIGNNIMADPLFDGKSVALLYCGDDAEAKAAVRQLAADLGLDPRDVGPLTQARVLEPAAMLWISMAVFHGYGREFAFGLMSR